MCGETKALSEFHGRPNTKYGLHHRCKTCSSTAGKVWYKANKERHNAASKAWHEANKKSVLARHKVHYDANKEREKARSRLWRKQNKNHRRSQQLTKKYGITLEDYEWMLENQNHACKICGTIDPSHTSGRMVVDHCHTTGNVRGLLCNRCNTGLGYFKDNPDFLASAIKYLNDSAETTKNDL